MHEAVSVCRTEAMPKSPALVSTLPPTSASTIPGCGFT